MKYSLLNGSVQALIMSYFFVLLLIISVSIIRHLAIFHKRNVRMLLLQIGIFIISFIVLVLLYTYMRMVTIQSDIPYLMQSFVDLPWLAFVIIAIIIRIIVYFCLKRQKEVQHSQITTGSIKEALDNIPSGICVYNAKGIILLSNYRMNLLHYDLTSEALQDGVLFWNRLKEEYQMRKKNIEVKMADGSIWNFRRFTYQEDKEIIYKITATNITDLYELSNELMQKNNALRNMHTHLLEYEKEVDNVTKAKERLEVKQRVHNQLGHLLLQTQLFLKDPSSESMKQEIVEAWEVHAAVFLKNDENDESFNMNQLIKSAKAIGLTLDIQGDIPRDQQKVSILLEAAAEAITNAVRHANAKNMWITCANENGISTFTFENDGEIPEGEISLGGGLTTLQTKVESLGGFIEINTSPKYKLCITLQA